jgi:DNA-binding PadR family transcriptional regulator
MLRAFWVPCAVLMMTWVPSVSAQVWVTCGEPVGHDGRDVAGAGSAQQRDQRAGQVGRRLVAGARVDSHVQIVSHDYRRLLVARNYAERMSGIRLFVLAFYAQHGEMHGYQVRAQAEREHVHLWTDISVGSVHGAIRRLTAEGLLTEVRVERDGNRPERQIYDITDAGRAALAMLRSRGLLDVHVQPDPFDLALTRLDPDTLDQLPAILEARIASLTALLDSVTACNALVQPQLTLAETLAVEHREHRLRTEIAWLGTILAAAPDIVADENARGAAPAGKLPPVTQVRAARGTDRRPG